MLDNLNLFVVILFVYEIGSIYMAYNKVKNEEKLSEFKHNSFLKKSGLAMLIIGTILNLVIVMNDFSIINFILLELFIIVHYWKVKKNIVIYENGMLYTGRFLKWTDIKKIEEIGEDKTRIDTKSKFKIFLLDKVKRQEELMDIIKSKVKETE